MAVLNRILLTSWIFITANAAAQSPRNPSLEVGAPAPPLSLQQFFFGDSVASLRKDQIYVIEFSAVGCHPCRKVIPHLSEIAERFKDVVTVISIYTMESNKKDSTDVRYLARIRNLVTALADKIRFSVAVDVYHQATASDWGVHATPSLFVVDRLGSIAWKGNNARLLDSVLPAIIDGSFNASTAEQQREQYNRALKRIQNHQSAGESDLALRKIDSMLVANPLAQSELTWLRYKTLVLHNAVEANAMLEDMLGRNIPGFAWDKFLAETWTHTNNPDYELALKVADRALKETELDEVRVHLLIQITNILQFAWYNRKLYPLGEVVNRSRILLHEAMQSAIRSSDTVLVSMVQKHINKFAYLQLSLTDPIKAGEFVNQILADTNAQIDWFDLIWDAIHYLPSPEYVSLIAVTDALKHRAKMEDNCTEWFRAWRMKCRLLVLAEKPDHLIEALNETRSICSTFGY
jgi:thiol-disulfide isomerase/thioredoxin